MNKESLIKIENEKIIQRFGKTFEPNEILFCEYQKGNQFFIIQKGSVKLIKKTNQKLQTLAVMGEGNILGEMSILEGQPRSATAIAISHVKVLAFDKQSFTTIIEKQTPMALKVLSLLAGRFYELKRNIMLLKLKDIQMKVIDVFLMEHEKQKLQNNLLQNQQSYLFYLSIQDIAHWCSESVDDVFHIIKNLQSKNKLIFSPTENKFEINFQEFNQFKRSIQTARKKIENAHP